MTVKQVTFRSSAIAHKNRLAWVMVLGWMCLIFLFSNQPTLPEIPGGWVDLVFKKLAHASAYSVLLGLWWYTLSTQKINLSPKTVLWLAFCLTVCYAISDEWHQTFIPGRHGQLADVLVDSSGALAMMIIFRLNPFNRLFT